MTAAAETGAAGNASEQAQQPSSDTNNTNPVDSLIGRLKARYGEHPGAEGAEQKTGNAAPAATTETATKAAPSTGEEGTEDKPDKGKTEDAPATEDKPPPEPEKAAAAKVDEETQRLELQHARALSDLRKAQSEAVQHKKRATTAESELAAIKASFEKNAVRALEKMTGKTLKEFLDATAEGKYDDNRPELPPEVLEAVEFAKQAKAERAANEARQARQAEFNAGLPRVKAFIESKSDDYALLNAFENGPAEVLSRVYAAHDRGEESPSVPEICAQVEQETRTVIERVLGNEKALKHMISADAKFRKTIHEALGLTQQQSAGPASSDQGKPPTKQVAEAKSEPRTVATQTEISTRSSEREFTEEELQAERLRRFRQWRETGRLA